MTVLHSVYDPDGRRVELTAERWSHITDQRPFMAGYLAEVLTAVSSPARTTAGHRPDEVWFYTGAGPSLWIKVVVVFEADRAFIVTAFPRRAYP